MNGEKLVNPIDEYFTDKAGHVSKFSELFKGNDDFIDQMTELSDKDIVDIGTLNLNDRYLMRRGFRPAFADYTHKYMRLMVSKERKSRGEYVEVHNADRLVENVNTSGLIKR